MSAIPRSLAVAAATFAVAVGVTGSQLTQAATTPVWAETLPVVLTAEQQAAADAQTAADQADAAAIQQLQVRGEKLEAERAAAAAAAAAKAAAAKKALDNAVANPRAAGAQLVAQRGWGSDQFACLDKLWTKESNWTVNADNPSSSAYGIPQALPGNKMATIGADWQTNPVTQITWGLNYIKGVYGTPCSAWAHSQSHNWY